MTSAVRRLTTRPWLLVPIGFIIALLLVEFTVRVATHSVFTGQTSGDSNVDVDPLLGRVPKAGVSLHHRQGFDINIVEHGTRSNGSEPAQAEQPLTLAVGDSFAFGDGVDDEDSWPAILERLSGQRVVNAAVPGFGLDQAVLRAEQLAPVYTPETIIVSFIPHDVLRCEIALDHRSRLQLDAIHGRDRSRHAAQDDPPRRSNEPGRLPSNPGRSS